MKKLIHIAKSAILPKGAVFLILNIEFAPFALAQSVQLQNPISANSFTDIIQKVAQLFTMVALPVAALFIVYSGFLFVTAQGNETKVKEARQTLLWSVVGTAVILGSYVIAAAFNQFAQSLR